VADDYPGPAIGSKAASLTAEVPDDVELGDLHFLTAFLGLFLGHARESGAGVVLPVETIRDALEHEDLLAKCKDRADCTASNRQAVAGM